MYKVAVFLKCQFVIQKHGYEILNTKEHRNHQWALYFIINILHFSSQNSMRRKIVTNSRICCELMANLDAYSYI